MNGKTGDQVDGKKRLGRRESERWEKLVNPEMGVWESSYLSGGFVSRECVKTAGSYGGMRRDVNTIEASQILTIGIMVSSSHGRRQGTKSTQATFYW